jgi:hypothetical protein
MVQIRRWKNYSKSIHSVRAENKRIWKENDKVTSQDKLTKWKTPQCLLLYSYCCY